MTSIDVRPPRRPATLAVRPRDDAATSAAPAKTAAAAPAAPAAAPNAAPVVDPAQRQAARARHVAIAHPAAAAIAARVPTPAPTPSAMPAAPAPALGSGRSIDDETTDRGARLRSLSASAVVPGRTLARGWWGDVKLQPDTRVTVGVARECHLNPTQNGVFVNPGPATACADVQLSKPLVVHTPIHDVEVHRVVWDFDKGQVASVNADGAPDALARMAADAAVRGLVADTAMGKPGYQPFADRDLAAHARDLATRFGGSDGAASSTDLADLKTLRDPTVTVHAEATRDLQAPHVTLPAGADVRVDVALRGSVQDALAGDVRLQSATLTSSGLRVDAGGDAVGRVTDVTVTPTGDRARPLDVSLDGFVPEGDLAAAYGGESLLRAGAALLGAAAGNPDAGSTSLSPHFVDGVVRGVASKLATDAVGPAIAEHRRDVPGLDLLRVVGAAP